MSAARLRPVTADDDAALVAVFASTREAELAALPPQAAELFAQSQFVVQRRAYEATYPALAEWAIVDDAGAVIGRLILSRGDDAIRLLDIALLPAARGRGIGTGLIQTLQAQALERPIVLHVEHARPAARRLYERLGFRVTASDQLHAEMRWLPS